MKNIQKTTKGPNAGVSKTNEAMSLTAALRVQVFKNAKISIVSKNFVFESDVPIDVGNDYVAVTHTKQVMFFPLDVIDRIIITPK